MQAALNHRLSSYEREAQNAIVEVEQAEEKLEGSSSPINIVKSSRKALDAYYQIGHNQVRWSFRVGVAAKLFGFAFLLTGLVAQVHVAQSR